MRSEDEADATPASPASREHAGDSKSPRGSGVPGGSGRGSSRGRCPDTGPFMLTSPGRLRKAITAALTALVVSGCALLPATVQSAGDEGDPTRDEEAPTRDERPAASETPSRDEEQGTESRSEAPARTEPEGQPQQDAPQEEAREQPWTELASGSQSAVRTPVTRAIRDPGLWADFWAAITANQLPPPPRPQVDFSERTAIVLLLGERRTGGYGISIRDVVYGSGEVEVVVEIERPEPGAMLTQALTAPYYIATIPATDREIVFTGDDVEAGFEGD